ncbi:unnamed protein product [Effrenium voratum]|nr:unnamed protein product [Effrenium voratum]
MPSETSDGTCGFCVSGNHILEIEDASPKYVQPVTLMQNNTDTDPTDLDNDGEEDSLPPAVSQELAEIRRLVGDWRVECEEEMAEGWDVRKALGFEASAEAVPAKKRTSYMGSPIDSDALNPISTSAQNRMQEHMSSFQRFVVSATFDQITGGMILLHSFCVGMAVNERALDPVSHCEGGLWTESHGAATAVFGIMSAAPVVGHRAAAAALTGLGGALCANGPDVVKVRLFAEPDRYPGFLAATADISAKEGFVRGLLIRGVSASAPRGAAIAIGEVTTYDHTKSILRKHWPGASVAEGQREPFMLHVATSLITGVVATTVAAPFDKLKSCVMADDGSRFPRGFMDALRFTLREEGAASLFRGWWPAYCRLGPHAILTFPLLEQVRKALGLEYL